MMQGFQTGNWSYRISDQNWTGFHESKLNGGCHQVLFLTYIQEFFAKASLEDCRLQVPFRTLLLESLGIKP
ncbi:hypothetical protein F2Q70_00021659 [Brassica cretica]|uniref:Uncharacterized protein n=1 Tax=Brassica cretica TaxID=69181 RepID=A0A8S9HML3_BRACR|nr:hypothetical protein F2Q70_00021659 [Brassica cretica]KAF2557666.1 hypothetical protein F2Q68_00015341 [Brassica cretica]